jgi:hypothetical protein
MIELSKRIVIDEQNQKVNPNLTIYPFSLSIFNKKTTFYAVNNAEKEDWVNACKDAIGYSSISHIYNIKAQYKLVTIIGVIGQRGIW